MYCRTRFFEALLASLVADTSQLVETIDRLIKHSTIIYYRRSYEHVLYRHSENVQMK